MTHRGHSDGWVVKNFRGTNVHKKYGNKIFASPNLLLCVGLLKSTVKMYLFLFISENTVVSIVIVPGSDPRTPNTDSSLSRHQKGDGEIRTHDAQIRKQWRKAIFQHKYYLDTYLECGLDCCCPLPLRLVGRRPPLPLICRTVEFWKIFIIENRSILQLTTVMILQLLIDRASFHFATHPPCCTVDNMTPYPPFIMTPRQKMNSCFFSRGDCKNTL